MNTLYDQFQSCIRHPHRRIVGVCSSCLQERLSSLVEPLPPPFDTRRAEQPSEQPRLLATLDRNAAVPPHEHEQEQETEPEPERDGKPCANPARPTLPCNVRDAIADMVPRAGRDTHKQETSSSHTFCSSSSAAMAPSSHGAGRDVQMSKAKLHSSSDCKARAGEVSENGRIKAWDGHSSGAAASSVNANLEIKCSTAHPPDSQTEDFVGETDRKKGVSWFLLSKSKSSMQETSPYADDYQSVRRNASKTPQCNGGMPKRQLTDRESTGKSLDHWRHASRPDLKGNAVSDGGRISSESGAPTSSWISVLFHRRKWPRFRSNSTTSCSTSIHNDARSDANGNGTHFREAKHGQSCGSEAGRLSWDGPRPPNLKQLLKKTEAGSMPQAPIDASPSQYAMNQYNDSGRGAANQAINYINLQKSKSVASARSSISVEMPKDVMQSSFSPPTVHQGQSNAMAGLDYDTYYEDQNLRRSRSWGRTWNRALSPLWGSRSHRHKVPLDASASVHQCNYSRMRTAVTPGPASANSSAMPSSSVHLSPLRTRSKLLPTLRKFL